MTVGDWLNMAREALAQSGVEAPKLEAELLAAHGLGVDRAFVLAHPEVEAPTSLGSLLDRRRGGEPLAYILGWREFYGRRFDVGPGVLIPRQETETLIEVSSPLLTIGGSALDLGTGSGCLAVTLALELPKATVTAVDISERALGVARRNADRLGASVRFVHSDLFSGLGGERFDVIVSNPPYVAVGEELPREVVEFEPREALFAGAGGLEFYERLAAEAGSRLNPGGRLAVEVGFTQAAAVAGLFGEAGWRVIEVRRDLSGRERVVVADRPSP